MKILLTGGSGFLGSALALHFCNLGHEVALLLRPMSNLNRLKGRDAEVIRGYFSSDTELADFVHTVKPDVVIHTACAYGRHGETMLQIIDSNLRFGAVLLQSLLQLNKPVSFINTGTALASNVSAYALSKHQLVEWGRMLADQSGGKLRFINVLLQHMYGPGDDGSKFTSHVLHACHRNDLELKLTAGEQARDFIFIDDVVSAYSTLLTRLEHVEMMQDIEIGSGVAPTIREFVETAHKLTGSQTLLLFGALPYRANEAMNCVANIESMRKIGWQPAFDLSTGLKKTIELEFK